MRSVPFIRVFNKVARWHGINPSKDIEPDTRDAIVERINDRIVEACGVWPWPEWNITEERAYRQVWNDSHQYLRVSFGGLPDEVFYKPTSSYYRVLASASDDPPIGNVPTDTLFWEDITTGIGTYIAYDQGCRRAIGSVLGVYLQNPSGCGCNGSGKLKFHPSHNGVEICHPGRPTVFVSYQMPVPRYSMVPYADGRTYAKADVIFDPVSGECFQALVATLNPPTTTDWGRVPFLEKWEKYVTNGAFADGMCESDQNGNMDIAQRQVLIDRAEQKSNDALQREVDLLVAQGQVLRWATCKRGEYWCESQPWGGGMVSEISDACETGWVFPDPPPQGPPSGAFRCPEVGECPELAYLGLPNVFRNVNTIPGLRVEARPVTEDYAFSVIDFVVLVDASSGPKTVTLPAALGSGQFYYAKKIDDSDNAVTLLAQTGDQIDGVPVFVLTEQNADVSVIDADLGFWSKFGLGNFDTGGNPPPDLSDYARLSIANIFQALNTFTGVRFQTRLVTEDYTLTEDDFAVFVDATAGPVTITVPEASTMIGQLFHVKQVDDSENVVTIAMSGSDLCDGAVSVNFVEQYGSALLFAGLPGYWDNIGTEVAGGGGGTELPFFRIRDLSPIHGAAFDVLDVDNVTWVEQTRYQLPDGGPAPVAEVSYWYRPEINDDAGVAAWPTAGYLENSRLDVIYPSGLRVWVIRPGAAGVGDIAPADYNAGTNNVHWESKM